MKKKLTILTVLTMVAALISLGGGVALGAMLVVDDDGLDCPDANYTSIQVAVNNATEENIILVCDGTYTENVRIDISLTLEATSKPIIDGGGTGNAITISADGVTIDGFEIRNGYNGIEAGSVSGTVIKNNDIHDNRNTPGSAGVGIMFWGDADDNTIVHNKIHDNDRQGIFIGHSDASKISEGNTISHNTIFNNGLDLTTTQPDPSQYGIQLWNGKGNAILHNKVSDHNTWYFGIGIYLFSSGNNLVSHNELKNNRMGITLYWSCEDNTIINNRIKNGVEPTSGFSATGIRIFDAASDRNTIADNKIERNAGWGVDVFSDNILADNKAKENGLGGYQIRGSGNLITNNKAEKNAGDGFKDTTASATNTFTNNKSEKNTGYGYNDEGTDNLFIENQCKGNTAGGSDPTGLCQ